LSRSWLYQLIITFWASASFYLMYVTKGENQYALIIPLVVGAVGLLFATLRSPVLYRVDPLLSFGVYLLIFGILASYLVNSDRYDLISMFGNIGSAVLLFFALYVITTKIDLDLKQTLLVQCLCAQPLFPVIVATSHDHFGRLMPGPNLTANYIGMMGLVAFIGACSARSWFWKIVLSLIPFYVIGAMQSRDSMLAVGVSGAIMLGCGAYNLGWKKMKRIAGPALIFGPVVVIGLDFAGIDLISRLYDTIANLFLLNDDYRGLGSGGSGRSDLWKAAINLWLANPIFGVGFKGHQNFMPDQMLAHNAYLGMLADLGVVGFTSYLIMVMVGGYSLMRPGAGRLADYPQRLAIFLSYLVYGMLESRAFSFGNTYSVLFLLIIFDSSKHRVTPPENLEIRHRGPTPASHTAPAAGLVSRSKT